MDMRLRYVGVVESEISDEDFELSAKALHAEFLELTNEAHDLEKKIASNFKKLF